MLCRSEKSVGWGGWPHEFAEIEITVDIILNDLCGRGTAADTVRSLRPWHSGRRVKIPAVVALRPTR